MTQPIPEQYSNPSPTIQQEDIPTAQAVPDPQPIEEPDPDPDKGV